MPPKNEMQLFFGGGRGGVGPYNKYHGILGNYDLRFQDLGVQDFRGLGFGFQGLGIRVSGFRACQDE